MTHIYRTAQVSFTAAQMFNLVNDVAAYPEFLSWCPKAEIVGSPEPETDTLAAQVEARLTLAKGPLQHAFTTVNTLYPPEKIVMHLREGPFKHLEGVWCFSALASGETEVSLSLVFEFQNKLLSMAIGPFFEQIAGSLVEAFILRAQQIYGGEGARDGCV